MQRTGVLLFSAFLISILPAAAQDPAEVWKGLSQPAFDSDKSATVDNVTLVRDRIHITLVDGQIQFSQPVAGRVFGAAFRGHGRLEIAPPNSLEVQQLHLFTGQDTLKMDFSEAAIVFSDGTFEDVSKQVHWSSGAAPLGDLYSSRQQERENLGAGALPRLFKSLLSADPKRSAFFLADLRTGDKGWIQVRMDALALEEVTVGRWVDYRYGRHYDGWMSFPAGDRSPFEVDREPLAKSDFEFRSYKIDLKVTSGAELFATTQANLGVRAAGERVLLFDMDDNLRVESVKDSKGNSLPFYQSRESKDRVQTYGDYLAVVLPGPTKVGEDLSLDFRYGGKRAIRKVGSGVFFCESSGWYPTKADQFASRSDFDMTFHFPKKYLIVATGSKVSETTDGEGAVSVWKSDIPIAVAGFTYGDYKYQPGKAGNVDIAVYANKEPDNWMKDIERAEADALPRQERGILTSESASGSVSPSQMAKTMSIEIANTLRVFQDYFGPYPYKSLAVTNIPYTYGQGWPSLLYLSSLSFLDSTQRNSLGIKDQIEISDFFRAHESSHQWWGHKVSWKTYHDQWLSEGFAQFSGNLYVQFRQSSNEYLRRIRLDKRDLFAADLKGRRYDSIGPIWMGYRLRSVDAPGGYDVVVYSKGGLVLHMLRMMLQDLKNPDFDQRFKEMMRDFCKTYENKAASTEDFKAIAEKHMIEAMDAEGNHRLDWFFRQYVYGTGVATYRLTYNFSSAPEGKTKVEAKITQSGVPAGWKDLLPLFAQTGGKTVRIGWFRADQPESTFNFVLPFTPDKMMLNVNEEILAEIK